MSQTLKNQMLYFYTYTLQNYLPVLRAIPVELLPPKGFDHYWPFDAWIANVYGDPPYIVCDLSDAAVVGSDEGSDECIRHCSPTVAIQFCDELDVFKRLRSCRLVPTGNIQTSRSMGGKAW